MRNYKYYAVRVSYDENYETLREFRFDDEKAANSFFDKAVRRAKRIGYGTVALFRGCAWRIKSVRVRKNGSLILTTGEKEG